MEVEAGAGGGRGGAGGPGGPGGRRPRTNDDEEIEGERASKDRETAAGPG